MFISAENISLKGTLRRQLQNLDKEETFKKKSMDGTSTYLHFPPRKLRTESRLSNSASEQISTFLT